MKWSPVRESNPHARRHEFLRLACLPVPSNWGCSGGKRFRFSWDLFGANAGIRTRDATLGRRAVASYTTFALISIRRCASFFSSTLDLLEHHRAVVIINSLDRLWL